MTKLKNGPPSVLILFLVGAVALGIVVALPVDEVTSWLVALWIVWSVTAAWVLFQPELPLATAGLTAWMLLNVVNGATTAVLGGLTWIGPYDFTGGTLGALRLATVAQGALLVGAVTTRLVHRTRRPSRVRARLSPRALDRWAVMLVVAGAASLLAYVLLSGANPASLVVVAGSSAYGDLGRSMSGSVVKYLLSLTSLVGVGLVVAVLRLMTGPRRALAVPVAVLAGGSLLLAVGGRRSLLVVPALACGLIWLKTTRSPLAGHPRRLLVGGLAALFVVASLIGGLRGQAGPKVLDPAGFVAGELRRGAFAPTAGMMDAVPDQVGFLGGRSYADLLALPIPRAIWDDKPEATITSFQSAFMPSDIGASIGFHGELYANFGWVGVALGCVGFGALLEYAWLRFAGSRRASTTFALAVAIPVLLQLFSRGYLAGGIASQFGLVVGVVLVARGLARMERTAQNGSPEGVPIPKRPPARVTAAVARAGATGS